MNREILLKKCDCGFETFKPKYVSKMIVIGNIFDNKELLNN